MHVTNLVSKRLSLVNLFGGVDSYNHGNRIQVTITSMWRSRRIPSQDWSHPPYNLIGDSQTFELGLIDCCHISNHEICLNPYVKSVSQLQNSPIRVQLSIFSAGVRHWCPRDQALDWSRHGVDNLTSLKQPLCSSFLCFSKAPWKLYAGT